MGELTLVYHRVVSIDKIRKVQIHSGNLLGALSVYGVKSGF